MKPRNLIFSAFLALTSLSAFGEELEEGFVSLFDGKSLKGWTSARSESKDDWGAFSVNEEEKAIHVYAGCEPDSKQNSDCLNTVAEYSHFILKLEYKWAGPRFEPRRDWDRDAGLLFHVHDNLKKVWPYCLEMQIGESPGDKPNARGNKGRFHSGDLFVLRPDLTTCTPFGIVYQDDETQEGEKKKLGGFFQAEGKRKRGKHVHTLLGAEKPMGEWNEMEIQVHGSKKAIFIFNGEKVLETFDFKFKDKDGNSVPLNKGHIGLQAEWAEILYRNIRIKELPSE